MNKTTLCIRILLIGASLLTFAFSAFMAYNHLKNKDNTSSNSSTTKNELTVETETVTEEKEVQNELTVYTIGDHNFENDENITFEEINLTDAQLKSSPVFLLVREEFMSPENQALFNELAEKGHSILFYNEEINPEDVVMYFEPKIMVVDMQSTLPLSFQAYGISTLNEQYIPLMIQTTSVAEIEVEAIYNLFNQLENLR